MTGAAQFRWHPAATARAGDAIAHGPGQAAAVIADRPALRAVQALFAAAAQGMAFRVGDDHGPLPTAGFETLTSGSSAAPRRIRREPSSWLASFAVNARLFGIGPGVRVAVLGRLVQSLALYGAVEALHLGADLDLLDGLRPDRQRAALAAAAVAVVYATPAQLRLMVEAGGPPLPALRLVLVGGSKLDAALRAALALASPGAQVREFYGAAEASFITLADSDTPEDAVGRAYPGVELVIREGSAPVAPGTLGQIWVRSPYLFTGYAGGDPGGAVWQDGWLSVGEIGQMVAGHLYLAGRAGRMVTVADRNVFPEEIELFLATLPGVARVAVIPRPDPRRGHVIEAVVMGDRAAEATILAAGRARFGVLAAPRRLHWRADWPLLPGGKTDLRALAAALPRSAGPA